jgi:hypothetical protein
MIKKKAAKKTAGKHSAKKDAKKRLKKEIDPAVVRKQVSQIVKSEATEMTQAVVEEAKKGQLAPVRYLFEMAKIFPEQVSPEQATEEEDCLAKILLSRIDAPQKPETDEDEAVHTEEEQSPGATAAVTSDGSESAKKETAQATVGMSTSVT